MSTFLTVLSYFGIGLLISFIYCLLCKYYNKHCSPSFMELIYTDISDTIEMIEAVVLLTLAWPFAIVLFIFMLFIIAVVFIFYHVFNFIIKQFNRLINKIIK